MCTNKNYKSGQNFNIFLKLTIMFQVYIFTLVVKLLQLNHSMSTLTKISELTQVLYEICQVSKIPFMREVEIFFKRKKQNKLFMCNTFI